MSGGAASKEAVNNSSGSAELCSLQTQVWSSCSILKDDESRHFLKKDFFRVTADYFEIDINIKSSRNMSPFVLHPIESTNEGTVYPSAGITVGTRYCLIG